jgi:hypothetical protein
MGQRFLLSLIIAYLPASPYVSGVIVLIYGILITHQIWSHRKSLNQIEEGKRKGLFSYLSRNYVLRQTINFLTIILIQLILIAAQVVIENVQAKGQALDTDVFATKAVPMLVLSLLLVNFLGNIFFFVWELKCSQILSKMKIIIKSSSSGSNSEVLEEKDTKVANSAGQMKLDE